MVKDQSQWDTWPNGQLMLTFTDLEVDVEVDAFVELLNATMFVVDETFEV